MSRSYAVILNEGSGARISALSRPFKPNHLLPLNKSNSMKLLQQIGCRVSENVAVSRLITVTHSWHGDDIVRHEDIYGRM